MKKILIIIAAVITVLLVFAVSVGGNALVSINAFSLCPFVLCFVIAVAGIGDIRFKDEEDGGLTKEECSLPIKAVAKIRHTRGLACIIFFIPEVFLIFITSGITKIILSLIIMALVFLIPGAVYRAEMKKALDTLKQEKST